MRRRGRGPFGLVFADCGGYDWEQLLALVTRGGYLVKDDLTPGRPVETDPVRALLFGHPHLVAVEVLTTSATAAVIATKRG